MGMRERVWKIRGMRGCHEVNKNEKEKGERIPLVNLA